MRLSALRSAPRSHKRRKRVGRGDGSNRGKTSCRGQKGDKSRSGYKRRFGHEGGQLPLYRRLPYRGFSNQRFKKPIFAINLDQLNEWFEEGEIVDVGALVDKGVPFYRLRRGFKVLARGGELTRNLLIKADMYSKSALKEIKRVKSEG